MDAEILYNQAQRRASIIYSYVQEWINCCILRVLKKTYERCAYNIIVSNGNEKIEIKLRDISFEAKLRRAGIELDTGPLRRYGKNAYRRDIPRVSLLRWCFTFEQEVVVRGGASMAISSERGRLLSVKVDLDSNNRGNGNGQMTQPKPKDGKIRFDSKIMAEARKDYEKTQDIFEDFLLND